MREKTALMYAIMTNHFDLVKLFFEYAPKTFIAKKYQSKTTNIVSLAAATGNLNMVKFIVQFLKFYPVILKNIFPLYEKNHHENSLYASVKANQLTIFLYLLRSYHPREIVRQDNQLSKLDDKLAYIVMQNLIRYSNTGILRGLSFQLGLINLQKLFTHKINGVTPFLMLFGRENNETDYPLYKECKLEHIQTLAQYVDIASLLNEPVVFFYIIHCEDIQLVKYLLEHTPCSSDQVITPSFSILHLVIRAHHCESIFNFYYETLAKKMRPDELEALWMKKNPDGQPPLMLALNVNRASTEGLKQIEDEPLKALIKPEAIRSFNTPDQEGTTPFVYAIHYRSSIAEHMLTMAIEKGDKQCISDMLKSVIAIGNIMHTNCLLDMIKRHNQQNGKNKIELKWSYFSELTKKNRIGNLYFEQMVFSSSDDIPLNYRTQIQRHLSKYYSMIISKAETEEKLNQISEDLKSDQHFFKKPFTTNIKLFAFDKYDFLMKKIKDKRATLTPISIEVSQSLVW